MSSVDLYGVRDPGSESFGPVLSLKQLWVIFWAYRYIILAVPVLFAAVAIGVVKFLVPKQYDARVTMFVAYQGGDTLSSDNIIGNDVWGFISTQMELMRSNGILIPVVEKLGLHKREDYVRRYVGDGSEDSLIRHAAAVLFERTYVLPGQGTRFMYLFARDEDRDFSATLANTIADVYMDVQLRQIVDPVNKRIDRYGEQIETLRANVEAAQTKIAEFQERTGLVNLREAVDVEGGRLSDLEQRLGDALAQRQAAQARLSRVRKGDTGVVDSALVSSLRTQIQAQQTLLLEKGQSLGPRHPTMISIRAEIEHLQNQLDRELRTFIGSAQSEVNSLKAIEAELEAEVEANRRESLRNRKHRDEGSRLLQALDSATKVYQSALDSFELAQFGTQMAVTNVNIISRATPPARPVPGGRKIIMMAIAFGGILAAGACLLYELLNRRIRCREDLEHDLNIPVLMELRPAS